MPHQRPNKKSHQDLQQSPLRIRRRVAAWLSPPPPAISYRSVGADPDPGSQYPVSMDYSLSVPSATEFKALYDETGWGDWTLERFEQALSGSWIVCTVRDDVGRLVGMGRLISDGALHAFVTEMIVTEHARGAGIGGQILARLVDEARRRGVDDVQLFAARGRVEFYERHGFERRPENGPGMDVASLR